ncbi:hypothetical protein SAMN00768000_3520 [Sulfobacillus thermosulfidooxidans DSM 9293]|uniref:Cof-type HAD-IIB family hydrolase n=1 Tax=Sulfobacillus thermosulfidooxidans (strain DSM 9293 / VKM B-1269 / AT-1) TaxID=929705 RepID=A0A1W1WNI9_SULTA|nr:Cof-type HAD-IIB family hydrolase [Sulfobacillus thermosulfidooxidans]SMC07898.1 hypothetical protein SAMN00768000_3520 [Sulfobacillus thermosulfidooxidans DSM 9293]
MLSNIKLIAIDLDGTLLNSQDRITAHTRDVLRKAIKQGYVVVIGTGRPYRRSKRYYEQLNLETPLINYHGALVHHPRNPTWGNFHSPLGSSITQGIIEKAQSFGVRNIFVDVRDSDLYLQSYHKELMRRFFNPRHLNICLLRDFSYSPATSVLIYPFRHNYQALKEHLYHRFYGEIRIIQWGPPWNLVEIVTHDVNKALGLSYICKQYDIHSENVISFGNAENDMEFIDFAGVGVAMENAIPQLKEKASFVTASNDNDGVAQFLEQQLLL